MTDYALTAGQQQQLVGFLDDGKGLYIGGNDFGYYHKSHTIYQMFGCTYLGDHNLFSSLSGQSDTLLEGAAISYTTGGYPDDYLDWIGANGGDMLLTGTNLNRAVAYSGPDGTYRAIHCAFWFGAMRNSGASHTKAEIMAAFVRYLNGDTMVVALENEIPMSTGGQVDLMLEAGLAAAGRSYGVLGSMSGTTPGFDFGSVHIPLNRDMVFNMIYANWNNQNWVNFQSTLDASGRGLATFDTVGPPPPSVVGQTIDFAWVTMSPLTFASNAASVQFVP